MAMILALGGDGIGPEILDQGLRIIDVLAVPAGLDVEIETGLLHGASYEASGTFCSEETLDRARRADAVLVGAVGGPEWDDLRLPGGPEHQDGLMYLRHHLDTFLGLRPARSWPQLNAQTPFRPEVIRNADILILREMCGGAMFARQRGVQVIDGKRQGYDLTAYDENEIKRFARGGFELARQRRGKLVSCDKSNVMESYKLWREVVTATAADYPDVTFENMFADNCGYQLMMRPGDFDVVLCCNQLGDLFSDMTGSLAGSLGMLPSACLAASPDAGTAVHGIYESTSGSAPDIAGKGIANPVGMILSVAMMFSFSFRRHDLGQRIEAAVEDTIATGHATPDIGGDLSTSEMTDAIIERLVA